MITEVENIILNREYFELSEEELKAVNELVQNAEEYEEMKWFLASTQKVIAGEKIEVTPHLKDKVIGHLNQAKSGRTFWLRRAGVFLWPINKEVYKRPAFQMSLAALLLIGFLMVYNRDIAPEGTMAINEIEVTEPDHGALEAGENEDNTPLEKIETVVSSENTKGQNTVGQDQSLSLGSSINENANGSELLKLGEEKLFGEKEEETDITHDGWYEPVLENPGRDDDNDYRENNPNPVVNANKNEFGNKEGSIFTKEQKLDNSSKAPNYTIVSKKSEENQKKIDRSKRKNKDADDLTYFDSDISESVIENNRDSLSLTTGGADGDMKQTIEEQQDPHSMGMYNMVTTDGKFETTTSGYFPTQRNINNTKELKDLFTTFK